VKGVVCATRWLLVAVAFSVLVACAAPVSPVSPLPPSPASIRREATPTSVQRIPTLLPVTPSPTPRKVVITPLPPLVPPPTPRPLQFDDVDARALLSALFPDLKLTPADDAFTVNGDSNWTMWINARAEGEFTQDGVSELAAIIANDAPHITPDQAKRHAPWGSFLAIFQKPEGKLQVARRAFLFPTALSPSAFDVRIDRVTDFDHDGQNELLIITEATTLGISTSAAFLYQWDDQTFAEIWAATVGEDNTGALNQPQYFATASEIRLVDIDGDGMDEIIVDGTRVDYARDAQGLPDIDREIARRSDRRVYRWGGTAFVLDPAQTTPMPR